MLKIKVKRFKQESAHRQTDGHTRTHTDATQRIISHAVDKNQFGVLMFILLECDIAISCDSSS